MHAIAKGGQSVLARLMLDRDPFGPPILGHKISSVGRQQKTPGIFARGISATAPKKLDQATCFRLLRQAHAGTRPRPNEGFAPQTCRPSDLARRTEDMCGATRDVRFVPIADIRPRRGIGRKVPEADSSRNVERLSDCGGKSAINNDLVASDI